MNKLFRNIFSLSVLQIVTYIVPLIILPYLVRVLGVDKFGLVVFAQSLCAYFIIVTDFGFSLSANRHISLYRDDKNRLNEVYSSTIYLKLILLLLSFIVFSFIIFSFEIYSKHILLYYLSFCLVIANTFIPTWLYQGLEKMNYLVISNVIIKVFTMVAILIFVKNTDDFYLVPIIYALSSVIIVCMLHFDIYKRLNIKLVKIPLYDLREYLIESSQFFLSRLANEGLMNSIVFFIGLKFGNTILGYYSMAEKLYRAFYMILSPINQALYPYMVKNRDVKIYKKVFSMIILVTIGASITSMIIAPFVFDILFKSTSQDSVNIFRILCIATFFGISNSLIGFPLLGALGYMKKANISLIYGSIIALIYLVIIYYSNLSYYYFTITIIIYESMSLSFRLYYCYKYKVLRNEY
ncbi:oligosaccharide flippase family protein [Photobacterium iliopiscarium]|uniref:oligosaccharide flippase family protein n=1 Tax=Photobacterium iliopiscarium TaxID=56192 RepID=UPI001E40EEE5|nr:oligosaccharide flippase family protein [Photobacterium iliopiscarium]MCD9486611.1 oligosaccharide flippase family protein [Photobacterium iliopiscarium]MCF2243226.1 oligosaccharide flippase family protein [Photobacterium iliopiscarium]